MKAAGRPSGWKRTQKEKLASLEDKLAEQLTSDIHKYREKWEAKYLRDFEQMEKWFFGLGKEKEKTMYPSCTPSEDMRHLLPRNNKKNAHDFSKMWSRRDYDAATLELITTNCSKASPSQAASMIAPIHAGELWKAVKSLHNGKAPGPDRLPNGI